MSELNIKHIFLEFIKNLTCLNLLLRKWLRQSNQIITF